MAVYSMYPIDYERRPHLPDVPLEGHAGGAPARRPDHCRAGRLVLAGRAATSSACPRRATGTCRSRSASKTVHFLVSHPTPPVFDGPEDRNGTRNYDEIRLWADYITPATRPATSTTTRVRAAGSSQATLFVIAGDQNSDPLDGDSIPGSIQQLLEHPLVNTKLTPSSLGAVEQSALQGGANATHESDPAFDTADFARLGDAARQPASRLRPAAQEPEDRRRGRVLATRGGSALRLGRALPVPELGSPTRLDRRLRSRRLTHSACGRGVKLAPRPYGVVWARQRACEVLCQVWQPRSPPRPTWRPRLSDAFGDQPTNPRMRVSSLWRRSTALRRADPRHDLGGGLSLASMRDRRGAWRRRLRVSGACACASRAAAGRALGPARSVTQPLVAPYLTRSMSRS